MAIRLNGVFGRGFMANVQSLLVKVRYAGMAHRASGWVLLASSIGSDAQPEPQAAQPPAPVPETQAVPGDPSGQSSGAPPPREPLGKRLRSWLPGCLIVIAAPIVTLFAASFFGQMARAANFRPPIPSPTLRPTPGPAAPATVPPPALTQPANGTPQVVERLVIHPGAEVFGLAFSPDGRQLAGAANGGVRFWDAKTGVELHPGNPNPYSLVWSVAFSPDGRLVASAHSPVELIDAATGAVLKSLQGHTDPVYTVAFSPDGRLLASGDAGGVVILWDPRAGTEVRKLTVGKNYVEGLAFSPDGTLLASASSDVRLWDPATSTQLSVLASGPARKVAFSPDGRLLATGGTDVQIWDVATRKLLRTLPVNAVQMNGLAFSPDGRLIATGSQDDMSEHGSVRMWEVATGKAIPLTAPSEIVFGVAFSSDGHSLATASRNNTVLLWTVP